MRSFAFALAVLFSCAGAPVQTPGPATQANAAVAAQESPGVQPASRSFSVEVEGKGPPMILIPGLSCKGSIWNSVVAHYRNSYRIQVISLDGFAGTPPKAGLAPGDLLPAVERDLASYIRAEKLSQPIVIGHSLGGFLALALAADEPELVGRVVSVDGLPFLSALFDPSATAEGSRAQAGALRDQIGSASQEQFAAQTKGSLATMITSPELAAGVAADSVKSDPRTVAEAMYEMMTTDLRPRLSKVRAKALLIGAGALVPEAARTQVADLYRGQVASIPDHQFELAAKARHFVMLDDPAFFFQTVDRFLQAKVAAK